MNSRKVKLKSKKCSRRGEKSEPPAPSPPLAPWRRGEGGLTEPPRVRKQAHHGGALISVTSFRKRAGLAKTRRKPASPPPLVLSSNDATLNKRELHDGERPLCHELQERPSPPT